MSAPFDLDDALDSLYRAPLAEFVEMRNELAASLKKVGNAEASKHVKALPKPSASAWAVNQLYWRERATFDAVIDAGDALRRALESGPSEDAARAERDRDAAVDEAMRGAKALVATSGQKPSETLMRRVATTLEALASLGSANPTPMRGRLREDVTPPGFGAFAALTPRVPEPPAPSPEDELARHEAAVARAKSRSTEARNRARRLEQHLAALQEELLEAHREAEAAAVELAEAEAALDEARARLD